MSRGVQHSEALVLKSIPSTVKAQDAWGLFSSLYPKGRELWLIIITLTVHIFILRPWRKSLRWKKTSDGWRKISEGKCKI